jgi:ABC-type Fe3+-siderophore transport system permease subunit
MESREEWERSIRQRQQALTPDQRIRAMGAMLRSMTPNEAPIKSPRELVRVLLGAGLLALGCLLFAQGVMYHYLTESFVRTWLTSSAGFIAVFALAAVCVGGGIYLVLSSVRL